MPTVMFLVAIAKVGIFLIDIFCIFTSDMQFSGGEAMTIKSANW